jgi:homocysteine S-methyltransferase
VRVAAEARDKYLAENPSYSRRTLLIAGSAGCYGAYLADGSEYRGKYGLSVSELVDFHRDRVQWLVEAGVDLIAFETLPCQVEGEAVAQLLAEFPETSAWVTFSCRDDRSVWEGESIEDCARAAAAADNVVAIGVNCTAPRHIAGLIPRLARATDRLIVVYPNRGEGWDAQAHAWTACEQAVDFAQLAREWRQLGARLIGGCCRTTPEDIHTIAKALHAG